MKYGSLIGSSSSKMLHFIGDRHITLELKPAERVVWFLPVNRCRNPFPGVFNQLGLIPRFFGQRTLIYALNVEARTEQNREA
jgi:hypothetical protein